MILSHQFTIGLCSSNHGSPRMISCFPIANTSSLSDSLCPPCIFTSAVVSLLTSPSLCNVLSTVLSGYSYFFFLTTSPHRPAIASVIALMLAPESISALTLCLFTCTRTVKCCLPFVATHIYYTSSCPVVFCMFSYSVN